MLALSNEAARDRVDMYTRVTMSLFLRRKKKTMSLFQS